MERKVMADLINMIQKETNIIPIEVKSNIHTKSRNLETYRKKYNPIYAIRISEKTLDLKTI